jgi:hypothetical protein
MWDEQLASFKAFAEAGAPARGTRRGVPRGRARLRR